MSDHQDMPGFDPDQPFREPPRPGETVGETVARALGNAQRYAEHLGEGAVLKAVYVVTVVQGPPDEDSPCGFEAIAYDASPVGYSTRIGMLRWAMEREESGE